MTRSEAGIYNGRGVAAAGLVLLLAGCRGVNPAAAITPGMGADEVRQKLGEPLITGRLNNTIPGQQVSQERWTYATGHGGDGLVVLMENNRVRQVTTRPGTMSALRRRVREGMSQTEVVQALGKPMTGAEGPPRPNGMWMYGDPVAPVETLMITFENNKAKTVAVVRNGAYR